MSRLIAHHSYLIALKGVMSLAEDGLTDLKRSGVFDQTLKGQNPDGRDSER